jgi:hypothetical protein
MISAQTRSAFIARENRYTLFRIMRQGSPTNEKAARKGGRTRESGFA